MDCPAWLQQRPKVSAKQLQLSERDGDVFDLAFLRPPSYFVEEFAMDGRPELQCEGEALCGVPGAWSLRNVLTPGECERLMVAAESIGFYKSAGIGPATKSGAPCPPKAVLVLRPEDAGVVFERIRSVLPERLESGLRLAGVNPRLRIHKYCSGFVLGPHYDRGHYRGSSVDEFGHLRFDFYGDDRHSQMSLLIYLNGVQDCPDGGQTTFFVGEEHISVDPVQGDAVAFFHGDHPLSPLHEGSVVREGFKYIIRTDVLYVDDGTQKSSLEETD